MDVAGEALTLAMDVARGLVGAMSSDIWTQVKQRITGVFGQNDSDPERQAERLERDRALILSASEEKLPQLEADLVNRWATRLSDFIEEFPEVIQSLKSIAHQLEQESNQIPGTSFTNIQQRADRGGKNIISGRDTYFHRP